MNSFKLKEERAVLVENMEAILEAAKSEDRDITEEEQNTWDGFNTEIESIDKKITIAERQEELNKSIAANVSATKPSKEVKELRDYSFQEAMKQAASGRLEGLVKEMDTEARNEARYLGSSYKGIAIPSSVLNYRAAVATSPSNATEVESWTDQLMNNLVLTSAGANYYSGVNNLKFPVFSDINSGFVAETGGSAPTAAGTSTSVTLSPKKCISIVNVSAEAMAQNAGLEAALRANMARSVAVQLELALLGDADLTNGPESIFLDATSQSVAGAAPTAAEIINMESTLITNGVNLQGARMAWLLDGGALAEVKTLAQVASVSPIWDNSEKMLAGYYAFTSQNVGGVAGTGTNYLLGDFSKVHIAQFGGLDILFDPYTNAGTGENRMIVTSLVDGNAVQNDTAFVKIANA
jgi:HK97 family phage major capsid protein